MTTIWQGCYEKRRRQFFLKASTSHPAKMAVGLSERIIQHGQERGWWRPGDILIDPFAGIFTTGIVGAYLGYRVIGVELEEPFCQIAFRNIERNREKLLRLGKPVPVVVQGDSRKQWEVLQDRLPLVSGAVTSPPYADTEITARSNFQSRFNPKGQPANVPTSQRRNGYILSGAITSPPYADTDIAAKTGPGSYGENFARTGKGPRALAQMESERYGVALGQLSGMQFGDLEQIVTALRFSGPISGMVTSPPFAGQSGGTGGASSGPINRRYPGLFERSLGGMRNGLAYGQTDGQVNAMSEGDLESVAGAITSPLDGETYWGACALIYRETLALLRPGGAPMPDSSDIDFCDCG